ncbi:MAG: glucose dehydrogenase [Acidobacteria bacterium]|nr:MAG: glucose dehydrogenase [Acidobacteriota bacterium]
MSGWVRISVGLAVVLAGAALLFGCGGNSSTNSNPGQQFIPPPMLGLTSFVTGLNAPIGFEAPNDGTNRIFIIEQPGTIRIIEYQVPTAGSNQADPTSERPMLVVDQPYDNHNGGQLAFGLDGFLYIAFGDGGSVGDPQGNGQNTNTLLAKILRIGVDPPFAAGKQYAIPPDNPFVNGGGLREIWAYGLRNPWRFSFDRATGLLFAGDVGQDSWEEVDIITKGGNFGWNVMEGANCYPPSVTSCNMTGLVLPIAVYGHNPAGGDAIIGGFVYHGSAIAGLAGTYVFGDLSSGHVWGLKQDATGSWRMTLVLTHGLTVSSFGQDSAGELYLVDYGNGAVLRLRAGP